MNILIVEDETAAAINLAELLRGEFGDVHIVGQTEGVAQTVAWLGENAIPDLIFMDIHLADGEAFEIFKQVNIVAPVIFTTAYDKYALEAFGVNSIDYILKPIKAAELNRAVEKWRRLSGMDNREYVGKVQKMTENHSTSGAFLVHIKDKLVPLRDDEIAFCYTNAEKVTAHTHDGRVLPMEGSLDSLITQLDMTKFYRANRQYIVARKSVNDISIWFGSRLKLNLTVDVPEQIIISKARVAEFKRWLTHI